MWRNGYFSSLGIVPILIVALGFSGCSVRKFAINKLGDSLANSGTTFGSDNDPEFTGQAVPFSLKLIEGLLAESPVTTVQGRPVTLAVYSEPQANEA